MGKTQSQAFPKVERKHSTKKGSKRKKDMKRFFEFNLICLTRVV